MCKLLRCSSNFGFGHVLEYMTFILNFNALHFTHSLTTKESVPKFSTHSQYFFKIISLLY